MTFRIRASLLAAVVFSFVLIGASPALGASITIDFPVDGVHYTTASLNMGYFGWGTGGFTPAELDAVQCDLHRDTAPVATVLSGACSGSFPFVAPTTDGQYTVTVSGNASGEAISAQATFYVDNAPPTLTIDQFTNGVTNDSTPTIGFSGDEALDAATVECAVTADKDTLPAGGAFAPCDSPYTPSTALTEGKHAFWVHAKDLAGNLSGDAGYEFTVDTTPPTITILAPTPGQLVDAANPDLNISVPDGAAVCSYDAESFVPCDAAFANRTLPDGQHTLHVRATDVAGNVAEKSVTFTIDAYLGPPQKPQSAKFRASKATAKSGGRKKRTLTVVIKPAEGVDAATACQGKATLSITGMRGRRPKTVKQQVQLRASGSNCAASATFVLPKAFSGERLKSKIVFAGNNEIGAFAITGKIKN